MILPDTNVVSAIMIPEPPVQVIDWLNRQETAKLHLSTVAIAEIGYGLSVMPDGKRRRDLAKRDQCRLVVDRHLMPRERADGRHAVWGQDQSFILGHRELS